MNRYLEKIARDWSTKEKTHHYVGLGVAGAMTGGVAGNVLGRAIPDSVGKHISLLSRSPSNTAVRVATKIGALGLGAAGIARASHDISKYQKTEK